LAYLVVRMKGTVNVPYGANYTLENLNLEKKFRATILPENPQSLGMLRKVKDLVAWTSADVQIIRELLEKRGRRPGSKPLRDSEPAKGYKNLQQLAEDIAGERVAISKLEGIKPWFALSPPRGGFKRKTKTSYAQKGVLGENSELAEIVKKMM
jgi:large subunit ribosomal protein L30